MKALVYHGPGKKAWEEKPKPSIRQPTDAVVRIARTTICGTDLHILKGKTVVAGTLDPRVLITHRFPLDEMERAYTTFGNAAKERALKVVLASD